MNNIIKPDFKPLQAIIVYQQDLDHQGDNYYLETRRIQKGRMMEGVPMTKTVLSKIMNEINTEDIDNIYCDGLLPKRLLYQGKNNLDVELIWYLKSSWQNLIFSKNLGIKDGVMKIPTLIFKLSGDTLSVFAVKTNSPKENTILYKAPFHNIYEGGNICMGNAKVLKSNEINEIMENNEKAFFQSKFTELHGGSPIKGNLNTMIGRCIDIKAALPNNLLIKHKNMKLKDLL
jgi:PRTRC genetic system protein B